MDRLCRYIRIPCTLLRMLLVSSLIVAVSWYNREGFWPGLGYGLASLILMQIGYIAFVIFLAASRSKRSD
jgi:hypothetical protein